MKTNRQFTSRQEAQVERNLATAMLTQRTPEELRAFLRDLCTPAELQAMADRWAVVECLQRDLPYREIHTPHRRQHHHHRARCPLPGHRQRRLLAGRSPPGEFAQWIRKPA